MSELLTSFLGDAVPSRAQGFDAFFDLYGLEKNPFPPNRMIVAEVLYNQDEAFGRFRSLAREVLGSSSPERRALALVAGTGGGKTHFLRHCQYIFSEITAEIERVFVVVEFAAGSGKVDDLVRLIYEACDEVCRTKNETDLATALARRLAANSDGGAIVTAIGLDDLRLSLENLVSALQNESQGVQVNASSGVSFDLLRGIFHRWIRGGSLTQTERKRLGVFARISTSSLAVRVLREMLSLARQLALIEGVLLCLDEVESLFTRGLNLGKIQAFLQDLRYLYDESVKVGGAGYSLLILSASTTTGAEALKERSYAVYQRLTYEGRNRVALEQIRSVSEARRFAQAYIGYFHSEWEKRHVEDRTPVNEPESLISLEEIEAAFREASGGAPSAPQGPLLDVLHRTVQEKKSRART